MTTTTTHKMSGNTSKPKALLLGNIDHAQDHWDSLSSIAELVTSPATNRADFIQQARSGALDGVVAAYRTVESVSQTGIWDTELVQSLPPSFRFICHNGAGYDQLRPAELLSARPDDPLIATNTPTAVDDATGDTALFLILAACRNYAPLAASVRRGEWRGPKPQLGRDPRGRTLGILGMGGIGGNLALKAQALGMQVVYHNRHRLDKELEHGAKYVDFEQLLSESDVISVHVPLSPATRHLLSDKEFEKMKDGVFIVNTARGAIIDEAALVRALEKGKVARAGLDVFEEEPKIHEGLMKSEKVFMLPHVGTFTKDTQKKMEIWAIDNVKAAVLGEYSQMSIIPEHKDAAPKEQNARSSL